MANLDDLVREVTEAEQVLAKARERLAAWRETDDGKAEVWMAQHGIDVTCATDHDGMPLRSQYIVTTEEILALAASVTDNEET